MPNDLQYTSRGVACPTNALSLSSWIHQEPTLSQSQFDWDNVTPTEKPEPEISIPPPKCKVATQWQKLKCQRCLQAMVMQGRNSRWRYVETKLVNSKFPLQEWIFPKACETGSKQVGDPPGWNSKSRAKPKLRQHGLGAWYHYRSIWSQNGKNSDCSRTDKASMHTNQRKQCNAQRGPLNHL